MPKHTGQISLPAASGGQVVLVVVDPVSWPQVAKQVAADKVLDAASAVFTLYPSRRLKSDRHEHSVLCVAGQGELQRLVDMSLESAGRSVTLRDPDVKWAAKQTLLSYLTGKVDPFTAMGQLVGYGETLAAVVGAPSHGALVPIAASLAKLANCPLVLSAVDSSSEDEAIERVAVGLRTKSDRFSLRRDWSDALKGRGLQQSALGLFIRNPVDQHVPHKEELGQGVAAPKLPPAPPTGPVAAAREPPAARKRATAAHVREFPMDAAMQVLLAPVKGVRDPREALSRWVLDRAGLEASARTTAAAAAGYDALSLPRSLDVAAAAVVKRSDEVLQALSEAAERPSEEFSLQNFSGEQPRWLPDVPRVARALLGGPDLIVPELVNEKSPSQAALFPGVCPRTGLPLAVQLHSLVPHGKSVVAVVPPGLAKGIVSAWPAAGQLVGTSRLVAAASAAAAAGVVDDTCVADDRGEEGLVKGSRAGMPPAGSGGVVPPSLPAWLAKAQQELNDSLGVEGRHRRMRHPRKAAPAVFVRLQDAGMPGVAPMWGASARSAAERSEESLPVEVLVAAAGGSEAKARIASQGRHTSDGACPLCHDGAAVGSVLEAELREARPDKHPPRFGPFASASAGQDDPDHLFPSPGMLSLLLATQGRPESIRMPTASTSQMRALVSMAASDEALAIVRAKSEDWALWNVDAESGEEVLATVEVDEEEEKEVELMVPGSAPADAVEAARRQRRDAAAAEGPRARHGVPLDSSAFAATAQATHQALELELEQNADDRGFSVSGSIVFGCLCGTAVMSYRYVSQHSAEVSRRAKVPAHIRWQLGPTSMKPLMAASLAAAGVFATFATVQSVLEVPWAASSVHGAAEGLQLLQQWRRHEVGGPLSKWFRERWLQPGLDRFQPSGPAANEAAQKPS